MLFSSLDFLLFFAAVYGLYLLLPHRGQNLLLLAASYFFYGSWDARFLILIALSTTVDYFVALRLSATQDRVRRRWLLWVSMGVGLGILGFFKYFNFFIDSFENLLMAIGVQSHWVRLDIVLPVGISFYTFQSMSYTIDVYRGQLTPVRNYLDYALYVSLFTQLVAGPIERATQLLPQIVSRRVVRWEHVQWGIWLFTWGLFKKLVIADNLAVIVDRVFAGEVPWNAGTVLLGVYAFAWQIYCDFSAYSDMARGLGFFMGFDIMINFRNPYFSRNPSDFWRRWHISLSTWLRDYLYIPLGGNQRGKRRTYVNLLTTMVLGGLWHGAAWTFVAWGAFHGGFLALHRVVKERRGHHGDPSNAVRILYIVGMFHAVCFGWLLFRAESLVDAFSMMLAFGSIPVANGELMGWIFKVAVLVVPLLGVQWLQERWRDQLAPLQLSFVPRVCLYSYVLLMIIAMGNTGGRAFIYFQF